MGISILILKFPEKIPDKKYVKYGLYASIIVFLLCVIGGIIFAVDMTIEEAWWGFSAGFYGGIIGSLLTAILYFLGMKNLEL